MNSRYASSTPNPIKLIRKDSPPVPCIQHNFNLIQFELPCGHYVCVRCLHEMRPINNTYMYHVISHCEYGGYLQIQDIEDRISHYDQQEAPVMHEWSLTGDQILCSQHHHNKVCLNLSCGRPLCLKCIQSFCKILDMPFKGEKRTHVKCICGTFIHQSEIEIWLKALPKTVTDARIIQRFDPGQKCNHHKENELCARLPCGVRLCHQCIVHLVQEAKRRHYREPVHQKQPFQSYCPGCTDTTIPGELLEVFLKEFDRVELPVFRRFDTDSWCKSHQHHKIVMHNDANSLLCKMCFVEKVHSDILLDEKRYSVKDAAKLFGDPSQEELFRHFKSRFTCDCGVLQAQAKLPCGRYICYHCVNELDQTNGRTCPKCHDILSAKHLRTYLEKYDESECYLIRTTGLEKNCYDHRHWKVFCESNTPFREQLCLICISQFKKFPGLPTNVVQHFLLKNDLKMKDLHDAPKHAQYSYQCTQHKHHKVICRAPCINEYCLRCIEELLQSTGKRHLKVAGDSVECVKCRGCDDLIPLDVLKSTMEVIKGGGNIEITCYNNVQCRCGSGKEAASFLCGASFCEDCFVKASSSGAISVFGKECITCSDGCCNDVIPIHTLKTFFSKGEKTADRPTEQKHNSNNTAPSGRGKPSTAESSVDKTSSMSQPTNKGHELMDTESTKSATRNPDTGSETRHSENIPTKTRRYAEERPPPSTCSRSKDHRETANIPTEQNHKLQTASSGMCKQSASGSSVDKQSQPSTSPSMNEERVSTATSSDTDSETLTIEVGPSEGRSKAYLKEKPSLSSCSRDKNHGVAVIEFNDCSHRMCEYCVNGKLSRGYPSLLCGIRKGSTFSCQTKIPIKVVTKYLQDRTTNNRVKLHFETSGMFTCSKMLCVKKAIVRFTDCNHRMCIDCMIKLSSNQETEKPTICGIGKVTSCKTVIPMQPVNEYIESIKKKTSFYIKEKPCERRCSKYLCSSKAVVEFRKCSHCMCKDCVFEKASNGKIICGVTPTGWFPCQNEIPIEVVDEYLLHYARNDMKWTPTRNNIDDCSNPYCTAEDTLKQLIHHRFTCNHKLCVICVSAQKKTEEDKIICKVPDCASSKIGQTDPEITASSKIGLTDPEITGIPNIGLTCYASCVLQVLAQTPGFNDSLRPYSPDSEKDDVETMLKELLKSVNDVSGREFYVNWNLMQRLMRKIFQIDRSFRQYQENDCHSFIMALFNALMKTEQDHKKQKDVGNSFLDGQDPDDDSGTGKGTENITNDGRPKAEADIGNTTGKSTCPTALFESRLTSQFKYSSCTDTENVDDQLFYSLLLPAVVEVKSIAEGLDLYFKSEEFPDNMLPCRKCKTQDDSTTTTRTLLMSKAPDMLMIQLARFREVTYFDDHYKELEKTDHQMKFEKTLTIKKVYTMDQKELEYELYGVVLHSGNMHGGHYTSCVRNLKSKKWYSCSDSSVREMPEKSLLQPRAFSNAYLLFYSKKK